MLRMMLTLIDTDKMAPFRWLNCKPAHERMFRAADANKDGRLTIEELQSWIQGRGDNR